MSGSSEEQKKIDENAEKKSRKRRREASKTKALTPLEGFELPLFGAVTLKQEIFRNTRRLIPIGDMRPEFKGKQRTNIVHRDGKFKVEGSLIEGSSAAIWFEELKRIPLPDVLDDKWEEGMCPFCYDSDGRRSRLEGKGKVMRRCYIHAFLRTDSTNLLHIEVQRRRTLFVNQEKGKWRPVPPFCSRPTCLATLMRHWARRNVFGASVETDIIPPFLIEEQEELLKKDPNAPDKLEATSEAFKYLEYARISEKGSNIHFEKSFLDVCPFCYENGARKPLRTLAVSLNGKTFYLKGRHITRSSFLSFLRADASREIARECVKRFTLVVGNWPGRRLPAFCAQQFCIYTLYRSWGAGSTFVFQPNTRTPPRRPSLLRYLLPPHSLIWRRCLQWEAEVLQDLTFKPGDCPFCFKDTKRFHDGSVKVKRIGRLNFNRFLKTGDPSHRIYRECIRRGMRLDGFAPKEKFPHFCNRETCLGFFYRRWKRFRRRGKPLYAAIKYVPPPSETEPITRYATTLCSGLTRISQDPDSDYLYLNDYPDLPHLKDYFPIARDAFQLLGCRENSLTLQRSYPWIARSIRRHASSLFSSIPAVMLSYLTPTEIEVFNYLMKDYRSESLEYLPFYNPLTSEPITEIMSQLLDATDYYPVHSSILKPWEPGNDHAVPRERLLSAPIEDVLCVASRRKAKYVSFFLHTLFFCFLIDAIFCSGQTRIASGQCRVFKSIPGTTLPSFLPSLS